MAHDPNATDGAYGPSREDVERAERQAAQDERREARAEERERAEKRARPAEPGPLPRWYKAVMFGLMIVGLLWIIVYYLTQAQFPVPALGGWNIMAGFGLALIGFLMMSRWRE